MSNVDLLFLRQVLPEVPWFTDRVINNITLGGMLVLVVIRTIQYNMTKMRVSTLPYFVPLECDFSHKW
jgi:hypothetical protein